MFRAKFNESSRTLVYSAAVIALVAIALFYGGGSGTFTVDAKNGIGANSVTSSSFAGTGTGAIPDDGPSEPNCHITVGTPLNVTFNVTGLTGSLSNVAVSFTGTHTFVGDITSTLIAPNGASHILFSRTGATTSTSIGDGSDLGGTYGFSDTFTSPPSGGWWQAAAAVDQTLPVAPGNYRTTQAGGAGTSSPAPATNMNPDFSTVSNPNGTWTLRFTDGCAGDSGSVTAATLTLDTSGGSVVHDANADFNGDGKTDWVVVRATTTPLASETTGVTGPLNYDPDVRVRANERSARRAARGNFIGNPLYWYISLNGLNESSLAQLGDDATDTIVVEDFDGDGKDDPAVWTDGPADTANFKILQSSTNTVRVELFGQSGDDPAVVGDYDGDGKADPAVFRCPPDSPGQCYFFFRGSLNNPTHGITYVPWGFGTDLDYLAYPGDFDGDGKNDFCIEGVNPSSPSNALFYLAKSGGGIEYIYWGLTSDFLVPGDYDGDGKTDFCVRRTISGQRYHYIAYRNGTTAFGIPWGITGDFSVPGDYDGDGKTDLAIWRQNDDPSQNYFWVLNSSGGVTTYEWGQAADVPAASWPVH